MASMTGTDVTKVLAEQSGTNSRDWFLVSRARYGMELVFRALADTHGVGEVVTQPFTCVTAVNPILAAGHIPRYADIEPDTLSADPASVATLLSSDTRAVVVQHSFGMEAPLAAIADVSRHQGAIVIEDAAHRPAAPLVDSRGYVIADVVVCSFGAEKMYSTRFGGAIYLNPAMADQAVYEKTRALLAALSAPAWYDVVRERVYPLLNAVLYRLPTGLSSLLRRLLLHVRLLRSPIVPVETTGHQAEIPALPSRHAIKRIYRALTSMSAVTQRSAHVAALKTVFRDDGDFTIPAGVWTANQPLVRFPVLARNADQAEIVFTRIGQIGYYAGRWYRPLLFPGVDSYETYHYTVGSCPVAEDIAARIVNIPTNIDIPSDHLKEIHHAFTA